MPLICIVCVCVCNSHPLICGAVHVDNDTNPSCQNADTQITHIQKNNNKLETATAKFIKTYAEADLLLFNVNSMLCIKLYWCSERAKERERDKDRQRGQEKSTLAFCNGMKFCRIMTKPILFRIWQIGGTSRMINMIWP